MVKNIIIVGTGKAARLHYQTYKKIGNFNILFLDIKRSSRFVFSDKIYLDIDILLKENDIDFDNTITDICTPCSEFSSIIQKLIELGEKNFIVEKPFVVVDNYFKDKMDINFLMIQNYKYSKITKYIKKYINSNNLKNTNIYINFSKNRIKESMKFRGISDEKNIPTCFEIEMPHEIYLANYFLNIKDKKYLRILVGDMKYKSLILPKHGFGYINYSNKNFSKNVVLESNLMNKSNDRYVKIECSDGTKINASYLTYDSNFTRLTKGKIEIIKKNKYINKIIKFDDNMYSCLKEYLYIINNKIDNTVFKKEILDFSKEMSFYLKKAVYIDNNNV